MSELAERERLRKQSWAAPGRAHDWVVRFLKIALPASIGLLLAYLTLAPLTKNKEISFILDKNKVEVAKERMRVQSALYRGLDNEGRPFALSADAAVQENSREQVVEVQGIRAQMMLASGPATLVARQGSYDLEAETVAIRGPVVLTRADGYELRTRDVTVDLNARTLRGGDGVEGSMPLGTFTAETMVADLPAREVTLGGRARLHIVQGALR